MLAGAAGTLLQAGVQTVQVRGVPRCVYAALRGQAPSCVWKQVSKVALDGEGVLSCSGAARGQKAGSQGPGLAWLCRHPRPTCTPRTHLWLPGCVCFPPLLLGDVTCSQEGVRASQAVL